MLIETAAEEEPSTTGRGARTRKAVGATLERGDHRALLIPKFTTDLHPHSPRKRSRRG